MNEFEDNGISYYRITLELEGEDVISIIPKDSLIYTLDYKEGDKVKVNERTMDGETIYDITDFRRTDSILICIYTFYTYYSINRKIKRWPIIIWPWYFFLQ
ncbi:MAG: hypothetical protein Q9M91_03475 [Candidatus Dojkabacteria bacterium]|nr:hypothetical protein [Candidatus Dojkabacteria bacterium]